MTDPGETPLMPTDHAIIESIRRGAPDAEIAARVGLSIREVKERIERLQQRFGVPDRASLVEVDLSNVEVSTLAASVPATSRPTGPDLFPDEEDHPSRDPVEDARGPGGPGSPAEPGDDDPLEPVYSRRAMLGTVLVGGATMAGVAGYFILESADGTAPAAPSGPFTPDTPEPEPTTPPAPEPHPGTSVIEDAGDSWVRTTVANGAPLGLEHGAGFVSLETGDTDVLQAPGEPGAHPLYRYRVSPRNEFILVEGLPGSLAETSHLYHRPAGRGYQWPASVLKLSYFDDEIFVFAGLRTGEQSRSELTGRFDILDADLAAVSTFDIVSARHGFAHIAASPDHEWLAINTGAQVYVVEVSTGAVARVEIPHPEDNGDGGEPPLQVGSVAPGHEAGTFRLEAYAIGAGDTPGATPELFEVQLGYRGRVASVESRGRQNPGDTKSTSPDGRYRVTQGSLRSRVPGEMPDSEDWVYTEVIETDEGTSLGRILSGQLQYHPVFDRRWLADSSGFIVEAQAVEPSVRSYLEWRQSREYYLVRLADEGVELEPFPLPGEAITLGWRAGPQPSPFDPGLFSIGGALAWDRASDILLGPADVPLLQALDPWGEREDEMRFAFVRTGESEGFATAGSGVGIGTSTMFPAPAQPAPGTLLPPVVESPPYRDTVTLAVARVDDCLDLREEAGSDAVILECLLEGTVVTVVDPANPPGGNPTGSGGPSAIAAGEGSPRSGQVYVHVQSETGPMGWLAIQHLDWA